MRRALPVIGVVKIRHDDDVCTQPRRAASRRALSLSLSLARPVWFLETDLRRPAVYHDRVAPPGGHTSNQTAVQSLIHRDKPGADGK